MPYAYITRIKNVQKHSNADKLNIGTCFGNQVIVSLDTQEDTLGVYFATDCQLGVEYAEQNNLLRKKDEAGNNIGGYLDETKRNIRALKLRGEMSDGLFIPLGSLTAFTDISKLTEGESVDVLDGVVIAQKYIPKRNASAYSVKNGLKKLAFKPVDYPLFEQHVDTSQYAYNRHVFKEGDVITLSLKMHGTSGRTAHTIKRTYPEPNLWNQILKALKIKPTFTDSYGIVTGSRRVVLDNYDGSFYGSDGFREKYHKLFENKLKKGETVYYELVGYTETGASIMSECNNAKTQDKTFIKQYGATTVFSYGCEPGENELYVYRMSLTNEDGETVEYPTWLIKQRCEEMNVNMVPVLDQFLYATPEDLEERVNKHFDGPDPVGLTHLREGIILRIENRSRFTAFKHKNFYFKVLEGIVKDAGVLDAEDAA